MDDNESKYSSGKALTFWGLFILSFLILIAVIFILIITVFFPSGSIIPAKEMIEVDPLKRIDWILVIFGTFMTVLILSYSIISVFLNNKYNNDVKKLFEREIEIFKKENRVDEFLNKEIKRIEGDFETKMPKKIENLMESQYHTKIFEYTRAFVREALILTNEYKELVINIYERSISEFAVLIEQCCKDPKITDQINSVLKDANYNAYTLSLLFSSSKDEDGQNALLKGLEAFIALPFLEAEHQLIKLEIVLRDNAKLYPKVIQALKEIESLKIRLNANSNFKDQDKSKGVH